jgi:hypothetical protein
MKERQCRGEQNLHRLGAVCLGALLAATGTIGAPSPVGASHCGGSDCWVVPLGTGAQGSATMQLCVVLTPVPTGFHRIVNVRHWQSGDACPITNFNSGHGQCSGYHVRTGSNHPTSNEPLGTFSPMSTWQQGNPADGRVCYTYDGDTVQHAGVTFVTTQRTIDFSTIWEDTWLLWTKLGAPSTASTLVRLPAGAKYVRIGSEPKHNPGYSDPEDPEDSNHWGTPTMITQLTSLAQIWRDEVTTGAGCSGGPVPKLRINDISLELGGLFDLNGQWTASLGHSSHRHGTDVDIRSARGNPDGGVPINRENLFCAIAIEEGFDDAVLESPHGTPAPPPPCQQMFFNMSQSNTHWHLNQ